MAKTKTELQQEEKIPTPVDVEWTDWVLGQLDSTELDDGAPKVSGLRRMCEKLIGEIVETDLCTVQIPTNDNLLRATVEVTIVIDRHDGKRVKYKDVSDACSKNADPPFNQYPPALAQTRAFGRCLRQALKLNVVTAEEKSDNSDYSAEVDTSSGPIQDVQIRGIEKFCKKLDISVQAYVNCGESQYDNIKKCTKNKGTLMIKTLQEFDKSEREIPEKIKGFDHDWRSVFG